MKRLIHILVLAVVLLQVDIMWVGYGVQQYHITQKMKAGDIAPANVKELTLSLEDYRALPASDEIVLNGRMYDVKEVTVTGSTVHMKAVEDVEEWELIGKMKNLGQKTGGNFAKQLSQLLELNYIPSGGQSVSYFPSPLFVAPPAREYATQSGHREINCPPPRCISLAFIS